MNKPIILLIPIMLICVALAYASTDYTWTEQTGSNSSYWGEYFQISANNSRIANIESTSGIVSISDDGGTTWYEINQSFPTSFFLSMSEDGQKMFLVGYTSGDVWFSSDGAITWINYSRPTNDSIWASTISGDGNYLYLATETNGEVWVSNDAENWTQYNIGYSGNIYFLKTNYNGSDVIVNTDSEYLYISHDYGQNYGSINDLGMDNWYGVSINSDGQYICALAHTNSTISRLAYSNDSGSSWQNKYFEHDVGYNISYECDMSDDGKVWVVSPFYISTNYGQYYRIMPQLNATGFYQMTISNDGTTLIGSPYPGYVWTANFTAPCSPCSAVCSPCSGSCTDTDLQSLFDSVNEVDIGDITWWNTSCITNMNAMFSNSDYNGNISGWDTSSVTDMDDMFSNNQYFNQSIGGWDTSQVLRLSGMFSNGIFNQDISSWNTANVWAMSNMFYSNPDFNQPIGSWNTGSASDMGSMFEDATSFNQDISSWDVTEGGIDLSNILKGATSFSTANYDKLLWAWANQAIGMTGVYLGVDNTQYTLRGKWGRDYLTNTYSWIITDAGLNAHNYCYQEDATIATHCGGLSTGAYQHYLMNYTVPAYNNENNTLMEYHFSDTTTPQDVRANVSVTPCFNNQTTLQFRLTTSNPFEIQCYNSTDWITLVTMGTYSNPGGGGDGWPIMIDGNYNTGGCFHNGGSYGYGCSGSLIAFFEEGIWWDIIYPPEIIMYDNFNENVSMVQNVSFPDFTSWHESPDGATETDVPEFSTVDNTLVINSTGGIGALAYYGSEGYYMHHLLNGHETVEWDMNIMSLDYEIWLNWGYYGGYIYPGSSYGMIEYFPFNSTHGEIRCSGGGGTPIEYNRTYHYSLYLNESDGAASCYVDGRVAGVFGIPYDPTGIFAWATMGTNLAYLDNFKITNGTILTAPCIEDWYCTGYGACINGTQICNSTIDLNLCDWPYTGNYSEFGTLSCGTNITGYEPVWNTSDLPEMVIDVVGGGLYELITLIAVVVLGLVTIYVTKQLKKVTKK